MHRLPTADDRIPVLPPGAPYLLEALNDDTLSFAEIARVIEHVPSIAARLMALSNSAWSAPITPITSLEAACGRLGLRVVRSASVALAVSQPFNPARCPSFNGCLFWGSALLNAEASSRLAERILIAEVPTARTTALLSNLGLIWLADMLPTETGAALTAAAEKPPGSLNNLLQQHCGLGLDEAGALLCRAWNLPQPMCIAIEQQYSPPPDATALTGVINCAARLVGVVRHQMDWNHADEHLNVLGVDEITQRLIIDSLRDSYNRTMQMADAMFPNC